MNKKIPSLIFGIILLAFLCGCTTAYKVARDKRDIKTIAKDEKIALTLKSNLLENKDIKGLAISVYCFEGNVFLVGVIEKKAQKREAIKLAKSVEGVRTVKTYLLDKNKYSKTSDTIDDFKITGKIKVNLIKDKEIVSTRIKVKTIYRHSILLGIVSDESVVKKAISHAKKVDGVKKVKSFLMVSNKVD